MLITANGAKEAHVNANGKNNNDIYNCLRIVNFSDFRSFFSPFVKGSAAL